MEAHHYGTTANLFTKRETLERVGTFDEGLLSGGDAEWCKRVYIAGYRLSYNGDARISHPARRSLLQMCRKIGRVTGGQYGLEQRGFTAQRGTVRNILRLMSIPFRLIYQLWFVEKRLQSVSSKLGVTCVTLVLRYVEAWEWTRLYLGRKPRRGTV